MPLYEADLDKIAVEVKSVSRKAKAPKAPKAKKSEEPVEPKKKAVRKRKAVEIEEPKVEEPKVEEPKVEEKVKVEPVPEPVPEPTKPEPIPEPAEVKPKKPRAPRKKRDPTEAPAWFNKYVEGVHKEQAVLKNEKVPAKKVKEEAQEAATKSWNHGLTRNRVQNEVDGHSKILLK